MVVHFLSYLLRWAFSRLDFCHPLNDLLLVVDEHCESSSELELLGDDGRLELSESSVSVAWKMDKTLRGITSGRGVPSVVTHVIPRFSQTSVTSR